MDGVLEGATVLCLCKLACSLLFLPAVTASLSPVSFCCCCLLLFTDLLVSVLLTVLWIAESWLPELSLSSDFNALRILLFLCRTYGAVLILTPPLIVVESFLRLLWPLADAGHAADRQGCEGAPTPYSGAAKVSAEAKEGDVTDEEREDEEWLQCHVVCYLCCLTVWVVSALHVRWGWNLEMLRAAACMYTTDSNTLLVCLPNLLTGSWPSLSEPCWSLAFLASLSLLLLLTVGTGLQRRRRACRAPTGLQRAEPHAENHYGGWWHLVPGLGASPKPASGAGTVSVWVSVPGPEPPVVDLEKAHNSCTVHRSCSWSGVQMPPCRHGDLVLLSCVAADGGGQEHKRTKGGIPLTYCTEQLTDPPYWSQCGWQQRGFPCLGVNVITGLAGVLSLCVLPLNLSVNILLIRTIETVLGMAMESLVAPWKRQQEKVLFLHTY